MRDINPADLCPQCKVIRTARSRHCAICNCCVERYDHHCPWINNCVGIKNHNAFMLFLISMWTKIAFHLIFASWSFIESINEGGPNCKKNIDCLKICLGCDNPIIFYSAVLFNVCLCAFYLLLTTILLFTHILNYLANRTTNERLSRSKKPKKSL